MEGNDIREVMTAFINHCAVHRKYDTYFGDTVPLSCANALGINIIVLNGSYKSCLSEIIFPKNKSKTRVFIYKRSDHQGVKQLRASDI